MTILKPEATMNAEHKTGEDGRGGSQFLELNFKPCCGCYSSAAPKSTTWTRTVLLWKGTGAQSANNMLCLLQSNGAPCWSFHHAAFHLSESGQELGRRKKRASTTYLGHEAHMQHLN